MGMRKITRGSIISIVMMETCSTCAAAAMNKLLPRTRRKTNSKTVLRDLQQFTGFSPLGAIGGSRMSSDCLFLSSNQYCDKRNFNYPPANPGDSFANALFTILPS